MRKRDVAILNDLQRFRCLTRNDIIELHFKGLKQYHSEKLAKGWAY